jgi:murein tripeptide amidase MpaA
MPASGYLSASGIESCLVYLANAYPSLCQLIVLPEASAEGRTMRALKLGKGGGEGRHGVLLVGGLHARELVNPDALVSLALSLCQAYTGNTSLAFGGKTFAAATIKLLVEALDIYLFPLVNPDGRSYVQAPSGDAWWRKNRRAIPGSSCIGVDLNRNFDFLWSSGIGTSADPCNYQTYKGTSAFSESETRNVRWLLEQYPVKCFMDVHSYSELILYPWGDDVNQSTDPTMNFTNPAYNGLRGNPSDSIYKEYIPSSDLNAYVNTGTRIRDAVAAVRGRTYTLEQSVGLYPTSGTSDDYIYSRFFANAATRKVRGYTLETGREFQPAFPEAWNVMQEAMSGALEFCVACLCVVEEISQGHRLSDYLDKLRYLRDDILLEHPMGRKYVELINEHSLELLLHTTANKELLELAQTLLTEVADVALSEKSVFEGRLITEMQKAMGLFSGGASPALKKSLKEIRSDLEVFKGKTLRGGLKAVADKPAPRPKRKRKVKAKPSKSKR